MPSRKKGFFSRRNDLALISISMVIMLSLIMMAEEPGLPVPDWLKDSTGYEAMPDDEENGTKVRTELDLGSWDGHTVEDGSTDLDLEVVQEGAVELRIELTWSDDIGDNDEFGLSLSNSTGEMGSVQGTSGSLSLTFTTDIEGGLVGDHSITVEALDCPGLVGPSPFDRDDGNSWSVSVTLVVEE